MKKGMRKRIAERIVEGIREGTITVDREGTVTRDGKVLKRRLSKYILLRMVREGATLKATGFYEA